MKTLHPTLETIAKMKALDVMTAPVVTVNMWDSIHDVAKLFLEKNISGAPVVDMDGIPLGVITKTDITRYDRERHGLDPADEEEVTLETWLTPSIFDVYPNTPLPAVAKKMLKYGTHHIFVTDKETKFVQGVITTFDILTLVSRTLNPDVPTS